MNAHQRRVARRRWERWHELGVWPKRVSFPKRFSRLRLAVADAIGDFSETPDTVAPTHSAMYFKETPDTAALTFKLELPAADSLLEITEEPIGFWERLKLVVADFINWLVSFREGGKNYRPA